MCQTTSYIPKIDLLSNNYIQNLLVASTEGIYHFDIFHCVIFLSFFCLLQFFKFLLLYFTYKNGFFLCYRKYALS